MIHQHFEASLHGLDLTPRHPKRCALAKLHPIAPWCSGARAFELWPPRGRARDNLKWHRSLNHLRQPQWQGWQGVIHFMPFSHMFIHFLQHLLSTVGATQLGTPNGLTGWVTSIRFQPQGALTCPREPAAWCFAISLRILELVNSCNWKKNKYCNSNLWQKHHKQVSTDYRKTDAQMDTFFPSRVLQGCTVSFSFLFHWFGDQLPTSSLWYPTHVVDIWSFGGSHSKRHSHRCVHRPCSGPCFRSSNRKPRSSSLHPSTNPAGRTQVPPAGKAILLEVPPEGSNATSTVLTWPSCDNTRLFCIFVGLCASISVKGPQGGFKHGSWHGDHGSFQRQISGDVFFQHPFIRPRHLGLEIAAAPWARSHEAKSAQLFARCLSVGKSRFGV